MAVGGQIFTSDPRFTSTASEDEGRYTLVISRVRPQDEGTYECQISTKPTKSLFIHLFITSMFLFLTLISRKSINRNMLYFQYFVIKIFYRKLFLEPSPNNSFSNRF